MVFPERLGIIGGYDFAALVTQHDGTHAIAEIGENRAKLVIKKRDEGVLVFCLTSAADAEISRYSRSDPCS